MEKEGQVKGSRGSSHGYYQQRPSVGCPTSGMTLCSVGGALPVAGIALLVRMSNQRPSCCAALHCTAPFLPPSSPPPDRD